MSKLFYNVQKDKANEFKTHVSNALGFVAETDNAGYIIANGKEYGKTRVSASNSFVVNGAQYSIIVDDTGALSVSKYIATSISSVTLSEISASATTTINGNNFSIDDEYVGTSYNLSVRILVPSSQSLKIDVDVSNDTGNKYKLAIHDGSSYLLNETSYTRTTSGKISYNTVNEIGSVDTISSSGTVTWADTKLSASTSGAKTFTVYLTESGKTPISKSTAQANITATATITPKVPFLYGTTGNYSGCTHLIKDIKRGDPSVNSYSTNLTFNEGDIPTFALPTYITKTLKCFNSTGTLEDNSLKRIETRTATLNGCTTEYAIYKYGSEAWVGSATINIKY